MRPETLPLSFRTLMSRESEDMVRTALRNFNPPEIQAERRNLKVSRHREKKKKKTKKEPRTVPVRSTLGGRRMKNASHPQLHSMFMVILSP